MWSNRPQKTVKIVDPAGAAQRARVRRRTSALNPSRHHALHAFASIRSEARLRALAPVHRADDGLVGPSLPRVLPPARAAGAGLHRDGHHRRAAAWRCRAPSALRPAGASDRAAARRQRAGRPRPLRAPGRAVGLRRDQPQLRLPLGARAARRLRRLPDGRAGAGGRLRQGDAGRGRRAGDGQASARHRPRRGLRLRPPLRRDAGACRLPRVHRARAQRRAEGPERSFPS